MQLQDISSLLTIVFPVRVDCEERQANLCTVLQHLAGLRCRMIVMEADTVPALDKEDWPDMVEYTFVEDTSPVFHRTRYINALLRMADTDIVGVWDTDVLVEYPQIREAVQLVQSGCTIAYPYNGEFVMLSEQMSTNIRKRPDFAYLRQLGAKSFMGRISCGGAYLVHLRRYMQCGGENERFTGWGPEDAERLHRVRILGRRAEWIRSGQLYHLYHPRSANSCYQSEEDACNLRQEFVKICNMDRETLESYLAL